MSQATCNSFVEAYRNLLAELQESANIVELVANEATGMSETVATHGANIQSVLDDRRAAEVNLNRSVEPLARELAQHGQATRGELERANEQTVAAIAYCSQAVQQGASDIHARVEHVMQMMIHARDTRESEHTIRASSLTSQVERSEESHAVLKGIAEHGRQVSISIAGAREEFVDADLKQQQRNRSLRQLAQLVSTIASSSAKDSWRQDVCTALVDFVESDDYPSVQRAVQDDDWSKLAELLEHSYGVSVPSERAARAWRNGLPLEAINELAGDASLQHRPEYEGLASMLFPNGGRSS